MSDIPTQTSSTASIPPTSVAVLDGQGQFTSGWRSFFQTLYQRSGGSSGSASIINQLIAAVAALQSELAELEAEIAGIEDNITTALDEADIAQQLALIAAGGANRTQRQGVLEGLVFMLLSRLNTVASSVSSLAILWNGVQKTASAKSLNFTGNTTVTDAAGAETIHIGGYLPLVTGDLSQPAPQFIVDPYGQCIGVPQL